MFEQYLISYNKTLFDALNKINEMESNDALTLFVKDVNDSVIGTITDGDIRRSLLSGGTLDTELKSIANVNFCFLRDNGGDVNIINVAKKRGIELLPVLDDDMRIVDVVNLKKQKSYLPIDAILMAGGKGERLRPLTEHIPKPLLKVGNKSIIDYNVENLISYGIKNISVTVNYLKEQIESHFLESKFPIQIKTVSEPKFLGTIGGVLFVENFYNDTILLMNSDLFTTINIEDFYLHFKDSKADMSIAAIPYTISVPYGIFNLDGDEIKGVLEKPTYNYYANAGIYLIKRELLKFIPKDVFFNVTDFIDLLLDKAYKVVRFPLNGTWIDIGNIQEYQKANELVKHI